MEVEKMKKEISEVISSLLYSHNCVIIPGFGGFVANYTPAHLQEDRLTVHPACKRIVFNASLINNDGLVLNAISEQLGITYNEAESKLEAFVQEISSKLNQYRNFEFKNLGTFYLNPEEKLLFVPYYGQNFLDESFGLPALKLKKVAQLPGNHGRATAQVGKKLLRRQSSQMNSDPASKKSSNKRSNKKGLAAMAVSVLGVALLALIGITFVPKHELDPIANDASKQDLQTAKQEETASVMPHPTEIDLLNTEEEIIDELYPPITNELSTSITEEELLDEEMIVSDDVATVTDETSADELFESYRNQRREQFVYHVVCMRTKSIDKAERLKNQLIRKEYRAEILDQIKSGWYLVSAEMLYTREMAEEFAEMTAHAEKLKTEIIELSL